MNEAYLEWLTSANHLAHAVLSVSISLELAVVFGLRFISAAVFIPNLATAFASAILAVFAKADVPVDTDVHAIESGEQRPYLVLFSQSTAIFASSRVKYLVRLAYSTKQKPQKTFFLRLRPSLIILISPHLLNSS